jgi:hypothetical protein
LGKDGFPAASLGIQHLTGVRAAVVDGHQYF